MRRRVFLRRGLEGLGALGIGGMATGKPGAEEPRPSGPFRESGAEAESPEGKRESDSPPPADPTPVRIAVVGVGNRGSYLLRSILGFPGTEVTAVCDLLEARTASASAIVEEARGRRPEVYGSGARGYEAMLERPDVDLVLVATPTRWHCAMSIQAMEAGKHVASEVPAGFSLEELEKLVRVKEATGKRYLLLENYIYSRANMLVLALATSGRLGEPYYAESSYIHDCRFMLFKKDGSLDWWGEWCTRNYGNDYPTHGLGPVSKWLGIHEGDRMERCSSFMTAPRVLERYAAKRFGPESPQGKLRWAQGEFTSTLIRTARGKVIRTDYDCNSPRPMSIYSLLQGTSGVFDSRSGIYFEDDADERWRPIEAHFAKDDHSEWRRHGEEALRTGHGGGDWFVLRDALEMVRQDRDPWIDVYDAAHWSSIYALSRKSIDADGTSVEIPDFTRGRWKTPGWRKDSMRPS